MHLSCKQSDSFLGFLFKAKLLPHLLDKTSREKRL